MGYGDWIFLGALLLVMGLGAMLGFGKVMASFVLNKIVRIIVAVFVCYTFGGVILGIPFVHQLLADLASHWSHIPILTKMHPEIIIYYIVLFVITLIAVFILARVLKGFSESKFLPIKILNKVGGAILLGALALVLLLFVFQIIGWIGGQSEEKFRTLLEISANAIVRPLYEHNPMLRLIKL